MQINVKKYEVAKASVKMFNEIIADGQTGSSLGIKLVPSLLAEQEDVFLTVDYTKKFG